MLFDPMCRCNALKIYTFFVRLAAAAQTTHNRRHFAVRYKPHLIAGHMPTISSPTTIASESSRKKRMTGLIDVCTYTAAKLFGMLR